MTEIHRDLGEIKANISTLTKQMDVVFNNLDEVKECTIKQNEQVKELCKKVDSYEKQRISCLDKFNTQDSKIEKVEKSTSNKALVAVSSFVGVIVVALYFIFGRN